MQTLKWLLPLALCLPLLAEAAPTPPKAAAHTVAEASSQRAYPTHGMSMKQVRKRYGKPASTRLSKGRTKKHWPRITVWNYGKFSVYFERNTVLHTVVH